MAKVLNAAITLALCATGAVAHAGFQSSVVSDSIGASSAESSGSSARSSANSSGGNRTASGDYRVTDVAQAPDHPGKVRLTLQPTSPERAEPALYVDVPRAAAERAKVSTGAIVHAQQRAYGVEFSDATTRKAFHLVLEDAWFRELKSRPLDL